MKKRIISMLLLLALVIGQIPAMAIEVDAGQSMPQFSSTTVVNPLYTDVPDDSTSSDVTDPIEEDTSTTVTRKAEYAASATKTYTSIADAAAFVRSQMANRQTEVTLSYRTIDEDDRRESIARSIVEQALDETGNCNEGDYLRWQYGQYVCDIQGDKISNGDGTYTYNYKMIYSFTYYTTAEQERELNDEIVEVLQSLDLNHATEYQKIRRIYEYICDNVVYDDEDTTTAKYTAYNALTEGKAVCQGYALLLYRMLREAGFSTRIIAGESTRDNESHAWNIVQLGDLYYYLDSTWDAGADWYDYFLRGEEGFLEHEPWPQYTTEEFLQTYPISETSYEPSDADIPDPNAGLLGQGTCGDDIAWNLSEDGVLTLRGSGKMDDYQADAAPWAELRDKITALDIGCGIVVIGANAFAGCTALTTAVILADSVRRIRAGAFADCAALPSVDVMPGVVDIAEDAFADGIIIRGCEGSAAETAAAQAGLTFQPVSDIADVSVQLDQQTYTYTGTAYTPAVTVTDEDGTEIDTIIVAYADNTNAGTAQVMVSGTDAYGGKVSVPFTIEQAQPQVEAPGGLGALRGQTLREVLHSSRFAWQEPEQSVGMQEGVQTFLMTYTPADTQNYQTVTDIPVEVTVHDTIGLSYSNAQTYVGADFQLVASAIPNNAPEDLLFWNSDNTDVATVSSQGVVTACAEGTAVITVQSVNGEYAQCTMTVGTLPFTDVPKDMWYFNGVAYNYGMGWFVGDTPTTFQPDWNMTRAMIVQVLYNIEGKPPVTQESQFSDVENGKWYTDAITWAAENNVVAGMGNGKFSPDGLVTREQTATILRNYAGMKGYSTLSDASISSYDDSNQVSNWAVRAMQWAVGNGLISGVGNNKLSPRGKASRAQVAQIMMQFDCNIVYG